MNTIANSRFTLNGKKCAIDTTDLRKYGGGFETMVFVNGDEFDCVRTQTLKAAVEAHNAMIDKFSMFGVKIFTIDLTDMIEEAI